MTKIFALEDSRLERKLQRLYQKPVFHNKRFKLINNIRDWILRKEKMLVLARGSQLPSAPGLLGYPLISE